MSEKVSGKLVVFLLFGGALLLWGIVFLVGYREKLDSRGPAVAEIRRDSATVADSLSAWMSPLPREWVKVTWVEGQGFVLFVPCFSSNSRVLARGVSDSVPDFACEYCEGPEEYRVAAAYRERGDGLRGNGGALTFRLEPPAGSVEIHPVTDSLLQKFPEAPFRQLLMIWIRRPGEAGADTAIFVPKDQENEFETLRAEDENPEGCGVEGE